MTKISSNLETIGNNTFEETKFVNLKNRYDIISALQTTLEFNKLIPIFSSKIESMILHSAFVYTNAEFGLEIKKGVFTRHSCSYALKFEEHQLGELKLMRNHCFDECRNKVIGNIALLLNLSVEKCDFISSGIKNGLHRPTHSNQ